MTPTEFTRDYIQRWEGSPAKGYYSIDPNDNGNWWLPGAKAQKKGQGTLIGSNYGVTGATLSTFLGRADITAADIKAITLDRATEIAMALFFRRPGLALLPWNRVTASVMDFGWGAGPSASVKMLQDMLDAPIQDGIVSPGGATVRLFTDMVTKQGEVFAAGAWWAMREEYYEALVARRPSDAIYLKGWDNRSRYFTPVSEWWTRAA